MKAQNILLATLCLFLIMACNNRAESTEVDSYSEAGSSEPEEFAAESVEDYKADEAQTTYRNNGPDGNTTEQGLLKSESFADVTLTAKDAQGSTATQPETPQKPAARSNDKIVKTGNVGIQVNDYSEDKHSFDDAIRKYDGYKANENEEKEISRISNTIEVRLPNQNFDKFIDEITTGKGIKNIDYKRTSAVDVGEEYYDLITRIKTKKEVEKRYIEILRKAGKITDILAVEDQIRVIREEIESKEGRLRFLEDRISYSTVSLYIYQDLEYNAPLADRPTFFGKVANAAKTGWNMILSFLLFLTYIWPILLLLVTTFVMYKKKVFIFKNRK